MEDYPGTLMEFKKRFSTDKACREYLFRLRWPDGFSCPRCGHVKAWPMKGALLRCVRCDYKASVIAGTVFQGTRKPLTLRFRAMWQKRGKQFYRLVQQAVAVEPLPYKQLITHTRGRKPRDHNI